MTKQLLSKIEGCYSSMSKGHKRITDYITENYDKAAFMTAAKLGDAVGVSESTVVRLRVRARLFQAILSFRRPCRR